MHLNNRLKDIEVNPENPFVNDALGRKRYAEILTSIVDAYGHSGCVLAICGKWGSGKTTFVKMWKAHLDHSGYKTIYFNAWESDYTTDPIVALVSELRSLNSDRNSISKITANIGRILLATGSSAIKSVLKNKVGIDCEVVNEALDEAKDIGIKSIEKYSEEKASLEDFKKSLSEYIADNASGKPVVYFVDELDRCRPDYAVKVLERIKHLFDIPDIIFVLSINKKQLECAIQGFYGTAKLDAEDYLRRFIDLEYELPKPNMKDFSQLLYKEYGFDDFLSSKERLMFFLREDEPTEFKVMASKIAEICQLDLRTQDRVFAICRVVLESMKANNYLLPDVLYLLCLLKVRYNDVYSGIRAKTYTVQALLDAIESTVFKDYHRGGSRSSTYDRSLEYTIATLLANYNKPYNGDVVDATFVGDSTDNKDQKNYPINVKKLNKEKLNEALNWVINNHNEKMHMGLEFSLDRIDLLNPFVKR